MPAPPRSFLTVTDTAIRWQVPALDIAGWAIDGEIALSTVLPTVETADKQIASGIVEIDGADVVALFRRDGASRKPALVRRFRRSKKTEWEWIARPVDGVAVNSADVIILRKEFETLKEETTLVAFSQTSLITVPSGVACDYCKETRQLYEEVAELSDKIKVEVHDFLLDREQVEKYKIARIPAMVLLDKDKKDLGVRFYGIPAGYEFASLVEGIRAAAGAPSPLKPATDSFELLSTGGQEQNRLRSP